MSHSRWMNRFRHSAPRGHPTKGKHALLLIVAAALVCTPAASAVAQGPDNLPSQLNALVKPELVQEFGPLNHEVLGDETQMWGRVITIDYQLAADTRLDNSWGDKVVLALSRLDITAEYDVSEVVAEQQVIAGKEFGRIQFTTGRTLEEPDVIGFTIMFPRER